MAEYLLVVGLLVIHKTILYLWYMISGLSASDLSQTQYEQTNLPRQLSGLLELSVIPPTPLIGLASHGRNLELEQSSYFPDTPDRRSLGHIPLPPLRRTPPRTRKGSSRSSLRVAHTHVKPLFPTIPSHTLPESPPEVSQGCSPTITHIPRGHLVYPLDTTLTQLQL